MLDCNWTTGTLSISLLRAPTSKRLISIYPTASQNHAFKLHVASETKTIELQLFHQRMSEFYFLPHFFLHFRCNDPDVEDYGNKWSLGALLRYLKKQGKDVKCKLGHFFMVSWILIGTFHTMLCIIKLSDSHFSVLLARVEDVVNKVVLCAEFPVATACKMFMPHRGNCFGKNPSFHSILNVLVAIKFPPSSSSSPHE